VDADRVRGDREWAAVTSDGSLASGKTNRRFRRVDGLLRWRATGGDDGPPVLTAPDSTTYVAGDPATDAALSADAGQPLRLAVEGDVPHHDDCPVHLVTTSSLASLGAALGGEVDHRRARANLVVATDEPGYPEDAWRWRRLHVGTEVVLGLELGMPRCRMLDLPPDGQGEVAPALGALASRDVALGLRAVVITPGRIRLGDEVRLG
jgi:uncharacterized protein